MPAKADFISMANVTELRSVSGGAGTYAVLDGYAKRGDGGGGLFLWNTTPERDNDGTRFNAAGFGSEAAGWSRIYSGTLNVRWFGALTSSDDSTALERALAALEGAGGTVYLPLGTYNISRTLSFPIGSAAVIFRGAGRRATKVKVLSGFNGSTALELVGSYSLRAYAHLCDFGLEGQGSTPAVGIFMEKAGPGSTLERIDVMGFGEGVRIGDDNNLTLLDCRCVYNSHWGLRTGWNLGDSAALTNNLRIIGGEYVMNGCDDEGDDFYGNIFLRGGRNHLIDGADVAAGRRCCLYAFMSHGITLNSCYLETYPDAPADPVDKTETRGLYFHGCEGVVVNGVNASNWFDATETRLMEFKDCHGVSVNSFNCERGSGGELINGTAIHIDSCHGLNISAPKIKDIHTGVYAYDARGAIVGPKFHSNVVVPLLTADHTFVVLSIIGMEQSALESSSVGQANRIVVLEPVVDVDSAHAQPSACAQVCSGTLDPNIETPPGGIAAGSGSLYLRVGGRANSGLYVKEGTRWVKK